jgi:hypothetical protein
VRSWHWPKALPEGQLGWHHQLMETREGLLDFLHSLAEHVDPQYAMRWDGAVAGPEFANVSLAYTRPGHACAAMAYGSHTVLDVGGHKIILAAERNVIRDRECVIIVVGHADAGMGGRPRLVLDGAWRLYGEPEQIALWAEDPAAAFAALLDRYGVRFEIEGHRMLWMPMMLVTLPEVEEGAEEDPLAFTRHVMRGLGIEDPTVLPEHAFVARLGMGGDGRLLVVGATMIDLERYRDDVERQR